VVSGRDVRTPWKGLGALLLVTLAVAAADAAAVSGGDGAARTIKIAIETTYIGLPATAAAAATIYRIANVRHALVVSGLAIITMAASDFIPTAGAPRGARLVLEADGTAAEHPTSMRWTASGAITLVALCIPSPECPRRPGASLSARTPAFAESLAFFKVAYLLAPLIAVGLCRWLYMWVDHSLLTMGQGSRWTLDMLLTWVSPVLVVVSILSLATQGMQAMLTTGQGPGPLIVAYLPLLLVAGAAWTVTPPHRTEAGD